MAVKLIYGSAFVVLLLSIALVYFEPIPREKYPGLVRKVHHELLKSVKYVGSFFCRSKVTAKGVFTPEELARYDGSGDSLGLYLAVLGRVYDVSKGAEHYRPGGGYSQFAGRDASRAYITGEFTEEGLTDDLNGISDENLLAFSQWVDFYEKDYTFVGKLAGRYYTNEGQPTSELRGVWAAIERAKQKTYLAQEQSKKFPPCNSEWTPDKGSSVWCSKKSGGVERDWAGVPRQYFERDTGSVRCVCVRNTGPPSDHPEGASHKNRGDLDDPHLKEYPGCPSTSDTCKVPDSQ
uniref:Cytochrome b5 domain containing protein n=1 Tax=Rhipicephalus appendiculatus TaxID=34631 RepID=A0A131YVR6_RHIAP